MQSKHSRERSVDEEEASQAAASASASKPNAASSSSAKRSASSREPSIPSASTAAFLAKALDLGRKTASSTTKRKAGGKASQPIEVEDSEDSGDSEDSDESAAGKSKDLLLELALRETEDRHKRRMLHDEQLKHLEDEIKAADQDVQGAKRTFDRMYGECFDGIDMDEFWAQNDELRGRDDHVRSLKALKTILESSRLSTEGLERAVIAIKDAAESTERALVMRLGRSTEEEDETSQ